VPLNILLVSPFENSATGRGDRNMRLEAELKKRGHNVTFVTGDFDHARRSRISKEELTTSGELKVLRLPVYRKNVGIARVWCHIIFAMKLWIFAIRTRWDIVVISSIPPEALIAARLLRKRALVVDVRDIWPDALQAYGKPTPAARIFGFYCNTLFGFALKHASRIMVVAPGFRRWLDRYGALTPWRVKFVPLGFRREDFRPLSNGSFDYDFCYAGGATPQFDIQEFADEFGEQSGIVLGSGPLLDTWKTAFPNTKFLGAIPRAEAMAIMGKSRRLLFPSNPFAQLPNKAFDYFALGHPVALGFGCSQATRYILSLRHRRACCGNDRWEDYRNLEKEAITARAASIVEEAIA